jgi:hypothetical protein
VQTLEGLRIWLYLNKMASANPFSGIRLKDGSLLGALLSRIQPIALTAFRGRRLVDQSVFIRSSQFLDGWP